MAIANFTVTNNEQIAITDSDPPTIPVTRVQGNARGTSTSGTLTVTLSQAPANDHSLVLAFTGEDAGQGNVGATINSISQTGVTWSKVNSRALGISNPIDSEIWLGQVGSGGSVTITLTLNNPFNLSSVANVCEYSAQLSVDRTAANNNGNAGGSGTSDTGTTTQTTGNNEVEVASISARSSGSQSAPTNGFTMLDGVVFNAVISNAYLEKIVTARGTANTGTTINPAAPWSGVIGTFYALGVPTVVFNINKVLNIPVTVAETLALHKTFKLLTADMLRLSDFILRTLLLHKAFTDAVSVSDYLSKLRAVWFILIREAISVRAVLVRNVTKMFSSALPIQDYLTRAGTIRFIRPLDVLRIVDRIEHSATLHKVFNEAVNLTDYLSAIGRLVVGISIALKSIGFYLENKLHPTERQGDTPSAVES